MFDATPMNPAELAAIAESAPRRGRKAKGREQPVSPTPSAPIIQGEADSVPDSDPVPLPPEWSSGHVPLAPYVPTPEITETIDEIVSFHSLRQGMIRAQTRLKLQGMASIRFMVQTDDDFSSDEAKDKARKRAEDLYNKVAGDPSHEMFTNIEPYLLAMEPLDTQRAIYEKALVKAAKRLPVYEWAKGVKGFGDISFATIVGECGDIGTYKSVSAVWKRLGLAVIDGKRQGAPGDEPIPLERLPYDLQQEVIAGQLTLKAATWIVHGYRAPRRSVSWNARKHVIGGMGKWRPRFGEDVDANPELTYYQRVYAHRARYEAPRCPRKDGSTDIRLSDKGKESYGAWTANRAHRYVEKRLLKHLYIEWRRASA